MAQKVEYMKKWKNVLPLGSVMDGMCNVCQFSLQLEGIRGQSCVFFS